jgi:ubiquinone biosynthesis O-methyltransferase
MKTIEGLLPIIWNEHYELERNKIYDLCKGKNVLDVGCGTGFFTYQIAKEAESVTGIDIFKDNITFANCNNRMNNVLFMTANAEKLPYKDDSFDIIFCSEVIEHIKNKGVAIKEFSRVLKHNGILLLVRTKPLEHTNYLYDKYKMLETEFNEVDAPEVHKGNFFLDMKELEHILSKNNFIQVYRKAIRSPFIIWLELQILYAKSRKLKGKKTVGFADQKDWLDTKAVKLYKIFLLPILKLLARIDWLFAFDKGGEILSYHLITKRAREK